LGEHYIIDPKAVRKDELYGRLETTTMEWTDGIFTSILRRITENQRREAQKRHWIVFDGDVDPQWAENLNSVLDDNRILTLPNGERIAVPANVRILFEVDTLRFATLASISRCGMVWYGEAAVTMKMMFFHHMSELRLAAAAAQPRGGDGADREETNRNVCLAGVEEFFEGDPSFVERCIEVAETQFKHVMSFSRVRAVQSLFALVQRGIANVVEFNEQNSEMPLDAENAKSYIGKWLLFSIFWGVGGSICMQDRTLFVEKICEFCPMQLPATLAGGITLLDYEVRLANGA